LMYKLLKYKKMERPTLNEQNSKILTKVENRIDGFKTLDGKLNYVECLSIFFNFDKITDGEEEQIDEYLRDYVMNS